MLRGLLIDSGDTLLRPRGGRWNPRFDFEEVVARHVGNVDLDRLGTAFAAGDRHLEQQGPATMAGASPSSQTPSSRMAEVYESLGLGALIETFVISEGLGFSTPDPRMFRTASDRLGLAPSECAFVDDNPDNLAGADPSGYLVCGMDRYGRAHDDAWPWVRDLDELVAHLSMLRRR